MKGRRILDLEISSGEFGKGNGSAQRISAASIPAEMYVAKFKSVSGEAETAIKVAVW